MHSKKFISSTSKICLRLLVDLITTIFKKKKHSDISAEYSLIQQFAHRPAGSHPRVCHARACMRVFIYCPHQTRWPAPHWASRVHAASVPRCSSALFCPPLHAHVAYARYIRWSWRPIVFARCSGFFFSFCIVVSCECEYRAVQFVGLEWRLY